MDGLSAGALRHRVQVQSKREERDASGGVVEVWKTLTTRWAAVEPLRGHELFTAQAVDARVTHRVTMRLIAELTASQRLVHKGRVFNIVSVLNLYERDIATQVMCMEDV